MTKSILFLNVHELHSVIACHELSGYSADVLACRHLFEQLGYDCYVSDFLNSPIVHKYWNKDRVVPQADVLNRIKEFDDCVIRFNNFNLDIITGRSDVPGCKWTADALLAANKCKGNVYNICVDYRPSAIPVHPRSHGWIVPTGFSFDALAYKEAYKLVFSKKYKILCSSITTPVALKDLRCDIALSNFSNYTPKYIQYKTKSVPDYKYDYLYGGGSEVIGERLERLNYLTKFIEDRATVGPIAIQGWTSITDYKRPENYAQVMAKAKINLVLAEPWHDFITLRFTESLVSGSIFLIDKKYEVGVRLAIGAGLKDRVVHCPDQVLRFSKKENTTELYNEQLSAYNYILNNLPKPILIA